MKLVIEERETAALFDWLRRPGRTMISCDLARAELMRAVMRASPDRAPSVRDVLARLTLVTVASTDFDAAGRLPPPTLRSLDAIHLAVALSLGDELRSVVTYDQRMRDAAVASGLRCEAPGM